VVKAVTGENATDSEDYSHSEVDNSNLVPVETINLLNRTLPSSVKEPELLGKREAPKND
jgi:hypothetical protein